MGEGWRTFPYIKQPIMSYQGSNISVNCCAKCGKNLTLALDQMGIDYCADCYYFKSIGVYSITDYNNWLKKNKSL
jgi:ribosomal protein L37AE/L43A